MDVKPSDNGETLVAAAKMPGCNLNAKSLVDAFKHVAVPRGGIFGADVPQAQIDVEVWALRGSELAKVKDVLQVTLRCLAGEFCVSVGRKVDLPHRWAGKDAAACTLDGGAVGGERQRERRLFQLLEVMYETGMLRRFAEDMEKDVLRADFLCSGDARIEKRSWHEAAQGSAGVATL